jgi:hypothetical protein
MPINLTATRVLFMILVMTAGFSSAGEIAASGKKHSEGQLTLSQEQLRAIGQKIYINETGGKLENLIAWNNGENFASLGIGHFIWFPENSTSPFTETFPALIDYFKAQNLAMPSWLQYTHDLPWSSKSAFMAASNSVKMSDLKDLLSNTMDYQVAFIHKRMQQALPLMLSHIESAAQQKLVSTNFHTLSSSELGLYALIDYVNFKGEGVSSTETYQGKGWGLLQVLQSMDPVNNNPHKAFHSACDEVLTRRVKLSSQQEVEQRWLAGWRKRCATYSCAAHSNIN